jgi:hypothetical protein
MEDEMAIRRADAERRGNLAQGSGHMRLGAAHLMARTASARMGDGKGTNPEERLGAAMPGASQWRWRFS